MKKQIAILGSTGSIGKQTLEVIEEHPELFDVYAITAHRSADLLIEQARKFNPEVVVIVDETYYTKVTEALSDLPIKVWTGADSLSQVVEADPIDIVVTAMVGFAGLRPTVAAIKAHKTIALANKETLVVAGDLIESLVAENHVAILPVDSEHSAIFQCLQGEYHNPIDKLIITASGGPFRTFTYEQMRDVTAAQALKHPNWDMGAKITIDCSTMVNKALEVMEAHWLFDVPIDRIQVVVQPKSVIHSMVQFIDGAVKAQLGVPSMLIPIEYAIYKTLRHRLPAEQKLDFTSLRSIEFDVPDMEVFEGLALGIQAGKTGGSMPTVFNAANEEAVALFLNGKIGYTDITKGIRLAMENHRLIENPDLEDIFQTENEAREFVRTLC